MILRLEKVFVHGGFDSEVPGLLKRQEEWKIKVQSFDFFYEMLLFLMMLDMKRCSFSWGIRWERPRVTKIRK